MPDLYWESAEALKKQCHDQLMELMSNYGKIDLLWFDGEWLALGGMDWNGERGWYRKDDWQTSEYMRVNYFWESEKLINEIRQLQPDIMINNRGGPVIADRWGGTTYRDNIVYVHILEWEKDQITFEIPGNTMEKWEVISGGKAELTEENGTFSISVPIPERDSIDTILKLTFAEPIVWEGCKGRENDVYGLADGLKEE